LLTTHRYDSSTDVDLTQLHRGRRWRNSNDLRERGHTSRGEHRGYCITIARAIAVPAYRTRGSRVYSPAGKPVGYGMDCRTMMSGCGCGST
jgi:hypothetical protein